MIAYIHESVLSYIDEHTYINTVTVVGCGVVGTVTERALFRRVSYIHELLAIFTAYIHTYSIIVPGLMCDSTPVHISGVSVL